MGSRKHILKKRPFLASNGFKRPFDPSLDTRRPGARPIVGSRRSVQDVASRSASSRACIARIAVRSWAGRGRTHTETRGSDVCSRRRRVWCAERRARGASASRARLLGGARRVAPRRYGDGDAGIAVAPGRVRGGRGVRGHAGGRVPDVRRATHRGGAFASRGAPTRALAPGAPAAPSSPTPLGRRSVVVSPRAEATSVCLPTAPLTPLPPARRSSRTSSTTPRKSPSPRRATPERSPCYASGEGRASRPVSAPAHERTKRSRGPARARERRARSPVGKVAPSG